MSARYVNCLLGLQKLSVSMTDGHGMGLPLMSGLHASVLTGRYPHCCSSPCPGSERTPPESVPAINVASLVSVSHCGPTFTNPDSHCADLFCCLGWKSQCLTLYHSQAIPYAPFVSRKVLTFSSLIGLCPQHRHLPESFLIQAVSTIAAWSQTLTWLYSSTDNSAVCGQGSLNWAVKLSLWMAVLYANRLAERKAGV